MHTSFHYRRENLDLGTVELRNCFIYNAYVYMYVIIN